ncbi:MAG: hypothetical protein WC055_00980 [Melioribacteraceae bacterium]
MKSRNFFVSNSSSSSFIVAVNGDNPKVKLEIEVDLRTYSRDTIKTVEELARYFVEGYCYSAEEMLEDDRYNQAKAAIQGGKVILMGSFSSKEGGVESFLCKNGLNNIGSSDMVVIESEGGY